MKKISILILSLLLTSFYLIAENNNSVRVGLLNGPTCIPAAYMMENKKSLTSAGQSASLTFESFSDPQTLLPKMIKKEIDIGFMPVNVAAKVYNSGNKALLCCAVTGFGNLKLITTDKNLRRFSELKGKRVFVAGQGATPEYMMRYILQENGLTYGEEGDVQLDYSIPTSQLAAQLISNKIEYAVLPEPFATIAQTKSNKVHAALDLQKEYIELSGASQIYPLSVMVVRSDFAKENQEILEAFLKEYENSLVWTISNPAAAGALSEKKGLGLAAGVVAKSIPVSNYVYIAAADSIQIIENLLNIFINCDAASIGGKLPEKDFYYDKNLQNRP